jgi:hypothetical protein
VDFILSDHDDLEVDRFRSQAFLPACPTLITSTLDPETDTAGSSRIPAISKWFARQKGNIEGVAHVSSPQGDYLARFQDILLPYELIAPQFDVENGHELVTLFRSHLEHSSHQSLADFLPTVPSEHHHAERFYSFHAPLGLLLQALKHHESTQNDFISTESKLPLLSQLYIAQAQISDLPKELRNDLPTPRLVLEAGKGDIYDANIWLGSPPTYTSLHKDPNPNFFVQLASNKIVRLFPPPVGMSIFHNVRKELGSQASPTFRGEEMMYGPEMLALEAAVWNCSSQIDGFETVVRPGDALFIPNGWWHSVKSINMDVSASANWWFR